MKSIFCNQNGYGFFSFVITVAIIAVGLAMVTSIRFSQREDNNIVKTQVNIQPEPDDNEQALSQLLNTEERMEKLNNIVLVLADNQRFILDTQLAKLKKESSNAVTMIKELENRLAILEREIDDCQEND